ncbi:MAG: bacterioferritin [Gammaproteobacteria bacterium]|nr:MAG: bacterioferritin [Gammaproteobacteria bacterium]
MQGDPHILRYLNTALKNELTGINQYFLHARLCRHWGLEGLNAVLYKKSILDMKQADQLIERIFFLEGLPNLQDLGALKIGEHAAEILNCDLAYQREHIALLREAVEACETAGDYVSRSLLCGILSAEENHLDWIEAQQYLIDNTGIENYLQTHIED